METAWLFDSLAITVAGVDFLDPALPGAPGDRERGVRVEVRPLETSYAGSVYSSPDLRLLPGVCRIDLLESAPYAADRMHWHPTMSDGEPGERVFEPAMVADPLAWLTTKLAELVAEDTAGQAGVTEVVAAAEKALAWARSPWPDVTHDERGMAM